MAAHRLGQVEAYLTVSEVLSEGSTAADRVLSPERNGFDRCRYATLGLSLKVGRFNSTFPLACRREAEIPLQRGYGVNPKRNLLSAFPRKGESRKKKNWIPDPQIESGQASRGWQLMDCSLLQRVSLKAGKYEKNRHIVFSHIMHFLYCSV